MSQSTPRGLRAVGRVADRVVDGLAVVERVAAAALLALVLVTAVTQVFMRYVLNTPLAASDELARFTLVWLAFIAAALTQSRDQHISVLVIRGKGSRRRRQVLDGLANVAALVTGAVLVYLGGETLDRSSGVTSASLEVPMSFVYLSVVVGFLLVAVHAVRNLVNLARFGVVAPEHGELSLSERQMS